LPTAEGEEVTCLVARMETAVAIGVLPATNHAEPPNPFSLRS
jgi:hypothetical protein